jgi:hypothetical protein
MKLPNLSRNQVQGLLAPYHLPDKVIILGIRGYFDPMGGNKHGIFDDAFFIYTPDDCRGFNGNTDPSVDRKGIAVLKPGVYHYKKGLHGLHHLDLEHSAADKQIYDELIRTGKDLSPIQGKSLPYWAFRQASNVTVIREGEGIFTDSPADRMWIDIHEGGEWTTSSEGCQTVFREQWPIFRDMGFGAMEKHQAPEVPYVLMDRPKDLVTG